MTNATADARAVVGYTHVQAFPPLEDAHSRVLPCYQKISRTVLLKSFMLPLAHHIRKQPSGSQRVTLPNYVESRAALDNIRLQHVFGGS